MQNPVQHEESPTKGAFYIDRDGERVAEMSYSRTNEHMIIIDHTNVDDSLRGQGVARQLLDALVAWARGTHTKVLPLCAYAKAQFDKDPSIRDLLA
ncbi:GNAT family N-acetyltransferase [Diaphorobacter aerolatus]|uniref:N-acetyltransferase n=1 Tax=Diaphorobacter aerolatus TaxID=1288495 RepID=A0A7H0GKI4_9BURK|nr:GNAT family N-acetyltransferase [Diaphorobacter aerolatus]QNP48800.1 N-acetyltransferase [Diaphorobacter aerolatus]